MKLAEGVMDVFAEYQYVPHTDRCTVGLTTVDPRFAQNVGTQMWDQRFAFQGTREEILEFCEELQSFLGGCSPDMYKKKKGAPPKGKAPEEEKEANYEETDCAKMAREQDSKK